MKKENLVKTILSAIGFFVLYLVVQLPASILVRLFYYLANSELRIADYATYDVKWQAFRETGAVYFALVGNLIFLAIVFIIFRVKKTSLRTRVRWNPVPLQTYALVAVLAVTGILAIDFLMNFIMPKSWLQEFLAYSAEMTNGGMLMNILLISLLGPFTEELLFRGLMAGKLDGRLPRLFVIVFVAVLFGVMHGSGGIGQIVNTTIWGLLFTLVFLWTNSLRASVLLHLLNNSLEDFLLLDLNISGMITPIRLVVGITACIITVFILYLICKRRNKYIVVV